MNRTTLYVYRDAHGVVLYVGITSRGLARSMEHSEGSAWWDQAASSTLSHYANREDALAAEADAIRRYRPPFNVVHNTGHGGIREAYLALGGARSLLEIDYQGDGPLSFDVSHLDPKVVSRMTKVPANRVLVSGAPARAVWLDGEAVLVLPAYPVPEARYRATLAMVPRLGSKWGVDAVLSPE